MKCLQNTCFAEITDVRDFTDQELDKYWEEYDDLPIPLMNEEQEEQWNDDNIPFDSSEAVHSTCPVTLLIHWCPNMEKFYIIGFPEDAVNNLEKYELIEFEGELVRNVIPSFKTYDEAEKFILQYLKE